MGVCVRTYRGHAMRTSTIAWGLLLALTTAGTAWSQSLAEVARKEEARRKALKAGGKVYTNDDLRKVPVTTPDPARPAEVPAEPGAAADKSKEAEAKPAEPSIDQGEDFWRKQISEARAARARSDSYLEALQSRLVQLTSDFYNQQDPALRSALWTQRTRVADDIQQLQKTMTDQDAAIAKIEEDARKANIPPGWIR